MSTRMMFGRTARLLRISGATLIICAGTPMDAMGQRSVRTYEAPWIVEEIDVDGHLNEPAWKNAPVASDFVQQVPLSGEPGLKTEARVLVAQEAVFVGAVLYDAPQSIVARLGRRDERFLYSDWFFVAFDSYDDNRSAFAFGVNPLGVEQDFKISSDDSKDWDWDAVWAVATSMRPD
ncbi:MAG: hypothetical protein ACREQV_16265, partial [Candidatus Binatia bacterium]